MENKHSDIVTVDYVHTSTHRYIKNYMTVQFYYL